MSELKYDRQNRIEGWNQSKLSNAKVAIVGAGALGNHVCLGLIGLGIGTLKIFDFDTIEAHNLNRQSLFCESDVNQSKAEILARRLKERNSSLTILGIQEKVDDDNIEDLFRGIHLVIDCVDRISTRRILSRFCLERNITLIHGGVSWNGGQVGILTRQSPCINCIYPDSEQEREKKSETSCTRKPEPSVVYISQIISGLMVERIRRVLMPLPIDPPLDIGLLKYQAELSPPFYFETIKRRETCECEKILKRVAPQILEQEQKVKKQKEKDQNSQDLTELKHILGV